MFLFVYILESMAKSSVPRKVTIEVNEVDQALLGPSTSNANDPKGVVVKDLVVLQDGSTLDLTKYIKDAAVEAAKLILAEILPDAAKKASFVGVRSKARKRSHEISEESDSEHDLESDPDVGNVLGAGVNVQNFATAGLGGDELSAQLFGDSYSESSDNEEPPTSPIPSHVETGQDIGPGNGPAGLGPNVDPDLPILDESTQNFYPNDCVVNWVRSCVNKKMSIDKQKKLQDKYVSDQSLDDLFSPIRITKSMRTAMSSQTQKDSDGKFLIELYAKNIFLGVKHFLEFLMPQL